MDVAGQFAGQLRRRELGLSLLEPALLDKRFGLALRGCKNVLA